MNSDLTVLAIRTALEAGALLKKGFSTVFEIEKKAGSQNLVTEYDKASEKLIISRIKEVFPDHKFLAEESGGVMDSNEIIWVIDPLDGTVNFAHNLPFFSVSIAACRIGEPLIGVVYQPMLGELFVAEKGKGAFLNGKRIHASKQDNLKNSILATGFPYNVTENPHHCIDHFMSFVSQGIPIRRVGSAALDLSYVACGRFDAYWEASLQPWDIAAGKLIVEEAGGIVTDYDGNPRSVFSEEPVLASNSILHPLMIKNIKHYAHRRQ